MAVTDTSLRLAANDAVDLHLHTFASDGTWTPADLIERLASIDIRVAALCDHDTQQNVVETIERGERRGIRVLPAVEVTVRHDDRQWHMLVYGIRPDDERPEAASFLDLMARQDANLRAIGVDTRRRVEASGRPLPSLAGIVGNGKMWAYPEVLTAMIRDGHVPRLKEAADLVSELGGRFNSDLPIAEVVAAAHRGGGICVMAHPGRPDLGPAMTAETLTRLLRDAPIDGLECHYRTYTDRDTARFRALAGEYDLVIGAGSDSHGPGYPVDPRTFKAIWVRKLLARMGIDVADLAEGPIWTPGMDPLAVKPQKRHGRRKRRMLSRWWRRR